MSKKNKKEKSADRLGFGKICVWSGRSMSVTANILIIGYVQIYCTSILGLDAILVGSLLLASKLIDGVTDILAGYLVDITHTRFGKGRPYELSVIGLWVFTVLLFCCPASAAVFVKSAWVVAMYFFVNSVFTTLLSAAEPVYMVRAFNDSEKYVALTSYSGVLSMLGAIVVNVGFPIAMGSLATSAGGWRTLVLIFSLPFAVIGILRFFIFKENYDVDATTEKVDFKELLKVLKTNKYIYIIAFMQFVSNLVGAMGVTVYYYTYIVENIEIQGIVSLTTMIMVPSMLFLPMLLKKMNKKQLIIAGFSIMAVGYLINWFALKSIPLLVVGSLLTGLGAVPASYLGTLMVIDCADYNENRGMPRMEGTLGVVPNFARKLSSAFGSFLLGVFLKIGGFISTTDGEVVAQPAQALTMIRALMSLIPLAMTVICIVVMLFYKLEKDLPRIHKENEERRLALAEEKASE